MTRQKDKLDKASEIEVSKLESYARIRKSEEWKIVKGILFEEINDLQSVMNIEGKTAEEIATKVSAAQGAVELLISVIQKIEGSQSTLNALIPKPKMDETDYIHNEDEE